MSSRVVTVHQMTYFWVLVCLTHKCTICDVCDVTSVLGFQNSYVVTHKTLQTHETFPQTVGEEDFPC